MAGTSDSTFLRGSDLFENQSEEVLQAVLHDKDTSTHKVNHANGSRCRSTGTLRVHEATKRLTESKASTMVSRPWPEMSPTCTRLRGPANALPSNTSGSKTLYMKPLAG